jgi:predicted Zn-dependent protease
MCNYYSDLLNSSLKKRELLKTGGTEEMERDMEEFDNNLALNTGIGKLKRGVKRKITAGEVRLPEEVKRKLGEANALYIGKDYGNAIAMLQEVITDHPEAYPAWNTLGLVHEELGNTAKSLQLRMVAAHMCNDASLWKELGQKSM